MKSRTVVPALHSTMSSHVSLWMGCGILIGWGYKKPVPIPISYRPANGWPGLQSRPPAPSEGVSARRFAAIQPFLEPVEHFSLNPPHSARTKVYPLGELPGLLQSCDVLR